MATTYIRIISLTILLSVLFGCGHNQVKYVQAECPQPPVIERPVLDTDSLQEGDDPGTVIQAHRTTIKNLQRWGLEQEAILDGYRKKQ